MREVTTEDAPLLEFPFSQGIVSNGFAFVSGQVPRDPETLEIVEGDIGAQAERTLRNCEAILAAAGASLDDVVKVTVFITDIDGFAAFNEAYRAFFSEPYPARSVIEVARLAAEFDVEIEMIAEV